MSFSLSAAAYLLTRRDFCPAEEVLREEEPPPLESRRLMISGLLDSSSPIGRRLSVFTGQSSRPFVGDKCRKAELIADHSADECQFRTIIRVSGRAAAVAEDAVGLSSARVELTGTPPSVVLEGSAAVCGNFPGDGRSSLSDCMKLGSQGGW